jgi:hypothetical protein
MNESLTVREASGQAQSAESLEAICAQMAQASLEKFSAGTRSIILTGSLARNEGTILPSGAVLRLIGDAEFVVVLRDECQLPPGGVVAGLCGRVEAALLGKGLIARVSAAVVHDDFLRRLKPRMFAYELRTCGRVIWGEPRILDLVPRFPASEIALEDAWRTLCNRSIEALEAIAAGDWNRPAVPRDVFYSIVKLYLDMASSLLLFTGGYEPGYGRRALRLSRLAAAAEGRTDTPFPLGPFSREVTACTDWKLHPDEPFERNATWDWCRSALRYAAQLWRWELVQLTGAIDASDNEQLIAKWMHTQSLADRLRGWLYVWRECGWRQGLRYLPRWTHLARRGSPRYWAYSILGKLLPQAFDSAAFGSEPLSRRLPLSTRPVPLGNGEAWTMLIDELAANYHRFLKNTAA